MLLIIEDSCQKTFGHLVAEQEAQCLGGSRNEGNHEENIKNNVLELIMCAFQVNLLWVQLQIPLGKKVSLQESNKYISMGFHFVYSIEAKAVVLYSVLSKQKYPC